MNIIDLSLLRQRQIEQLLATSMFIRPMDTAITCGWLDAELISDELIRHYWTTAVQAIQPVMTDDEAHNASVAAAMETGILPKLMDWSKDLPFMDTAEAYASEIMRRRYLTDVSIGVGKLLQAIQQQDSDAAAQIIRELADIRNGHRPPIETLATLAVKFDRAVMDGNRSIETFVPGLDAALGGLERQTLTVVAARPSMGKTALLLQIARNVAQSGKRASFYSLEMSSISLWARAACPLVGVTWRDVRAGKLTPEKRSELIQASYDLADQYGDRLRLIDAPQTTDSLWRSVAEDRPDLVIADHLRLFGDRGENENKRQGMIAQRLKEIAKTFSTAVVSAVQLNRGVEARADRRPQLSDLRDSGEIEEVADVVLMLYRPDYYSTNGAPRNGRSATEIWVRKFRDGPAGALISLDFDLRQEWFVAKEA